MSKRSDHSVRGLDAPPLGARRLAFVHGIEDTWETWTPLVAALKPDFGHVALDMPWRAGNDYRWRREHSPGGWLAELLAPLSDKVEILVGHSFGANAILELLATGGGAGFAAAILVSPLYCPHIDLVSWPSFEMSRRHFETQILKGLRLRLGARADTIDPELLARMGEKTLQRVGPIGFVAVFDHFAATAEFDLARIDVPILVLGGAADPVIARGRVERLVERIRRARLVIDDEADHFYHVLHPSRLGGHISAFLASVTAGLQ